MREGKGKFTALDVLRFLAVASAAGFFIATLQARSVNGPMLVVTALLSGILWKKEQMEAPEWDDVEDEE